MKISKSSKVYMDILRQKTFDTYMEIEGLSESAKITIIKSISGDYKPMFGCHLEEDE